MKIYNYNKDTHEFMFESEAQKNPVREGEYIYPKNSTTVIPPLLKDNETAVFADGLWKIVPDFRGTKVINTETKECSEITDIGSIPAGFMIYEEFLKTDMYKEYLLKTEQENLKVEILEDIKALDEKRIRAICEPSVKDGNTGETWLDYYNNQVVKLRQKLTEVEYGA